MNRAKITRAGKEGAGRSGRSIRANAPGSYYGTAETRAGVPQGERHIPSPIRYARVPARAVDAPLHEFQAVAELFEPLPAQRYKQRTVRCYTLGRHLCNLVTSHRGARCAKPLPGKALRHQQKGCC